VPAACGSAKGAWHAANVAAARREEDGLWQKEDREWSLNDICNVFF